MLGSYVVTWVLNQPAKGAMSGRDSELTINQATPISPQAFDLMSGG